MFVIDSARLERGACSYILNVYFLVSIPILKISADNVQLGKPDTHVLIRPQLCQTRARNGIPNSGHLRKQVV